MMRIAITAGSGALLLGMALLAAAPALAGDVSVQLDAGAGFSVKNNTGTVERLRVDEATGNVSRNGALFVHTTGTQNVFAGEGAGNPATSGTGLNAAFGHNALHANTTGFSNSAFGQGALGVNTVGTRNSAFGKGALSANIDGSYNSAFGIDSLRDGPHASYNSAFGQGALRSSTWGPNSAFGMNALLFNTTGYFNTAVGSHALLANTTAAYNTGVGYASLRHNTTGHHSQAVGAEALLSNTTGNENSALGARALAANTTGSRNTAVGRYAGFNQTTGNDNIYLANTGVAAESGKIKIGNTAHTETFIEGIDGNTAIGGVAVLINSSNELHTLVSSARFKQDVRDMADASGVLMKLRPVAFRYREEAVGAEGARVEQYGLIAEEVAEVAPELVARDPEGRPYSVQYHVLPALLLNEMQKQQRTIAKLEARIAELEREPREEGQR